MGARFALGGIAWSAADGVDAAQLRGVLEAALAALESGAARNVKSGRRKQLYPLYLAGGDEPSHLLKVNGYHGLGALRRRLLGSKARRELRLAQRAARRGLATPVPLAAGERRSALGVERCYLLVPFVPGARDLRRVAAGPLARAERRALALAFGRFARRVHDAGILQDDFQPNNFLLTPEGVDRVQIIDFERAAWRPRLGARARAWALAKLERELPAATLGDRARFVRGYAGEGRAARRALWRDVEAALPALARFDFARLRRKLAAPGEDAGAAREAPAGYVLRAEGDDFALNFPADGAAAVRDAHALALLLARRGLAPLPLRAHWSAPSSGRLVFAGALPRRLHELAPHERSAAHAALTLLIERLARLGTVPDLRADLVGVAPAGAPLALQLLAAPVLRLGAAGPRGPAARALSARLLGLDAR